MSEGTIERLNYFNGQRLEATDFRAEQGYHINIRRWLNHSLFTPGIGAGLEVEKLAPEPAHAVLVQPGLALDSAGREIILVEERVVPVAGKPTEPADPVTGNYLVIEYSEQTSAVVKDGCAVYIGGIGKAKEDIMWGAPSRIVADPKIYIQHQWPKTEDNKIVLAQLELNKDCSVRTIRTFVRKYAGIAEASKLRSYALEGEKDLDKDNPKQLYFRIEGGTPKSAILILRGAKFSSLYYTELGQHTHGITVTLKLAGAVDAHSHALGELKTSFVDPPKHLASSRTDTVPQDDNAIFIDNADDPSQMVDLVALANLTVTHEAGHDHVIAAGENTEKAGAIKGHTHGVNSSVEKAGVNSPARTGAPRSYINNLKVAFDGEDTTPSVLAQLTDRDGGGWDKLGDGSKDHNFSAATGDGMVKGSGEIDLLRLGIDLSPGEHWLTFSVPSGGGKLLYNLYID